MYLLMYDINNINEFNAIMVQCREEECCCSYLNTAWIDPTSLNQIRKNTAPFLRECY